MTSGETVAGGGGLLAPVEAAAPESGWSVRRYLAVVFGVAAAGTAALGFGVYIGEPAAVAVLFGLPVLLLVMLKPEMGLLLIALIVPFEYFARFGEFFTVTKGLGLVTFVAVLLHLVGPMRLEVRAGAFWWALGLGLWSLVTILGARDPRWAWFVMLTLIQMIGLLFVSVNAIRNENQLVALLWAMFIASAAAALAAFFLSPAPEWREMLQRAAVGAKAANQHAKTLFPAMFLMPFLLRRHRGWMRVLIFGAVLLALVGLMRSGSRSCWIGTVLGVGVGILCYRGVALPRRAGYVVVALMGLAAFVVVGTLVGAWDLRLLERFAELRQTGFREGGRLWFWQHAFMMGAKNPLIGVGPGNFRVEIMQFRVGYKVTHNDLLAQFAETGLPGLVCYIGFIVAIFRKAARTAPPLLAAGLVGMMVAAVTAGMVNPSMGQKSFWMQASVAVISGLVFARGAAVAESAWQPGKRRGPALAGRGHRA